MVIVPGCRPSMWKPPLASALIATSLACTSTTRTATPLTGVLLSASSAAPVMLPVLGLASSGQSTSKYDGPVGATAKAGGGGAGGAKGAGGAPGAPGGAPGAGAAAGAAGAAVGPAAFTTAVHCASL